MNYSMVNDFNAPKRQNGILSKLKATFTSGHSDLSLEWKMLN